MPADHARGASAVGVLGQTVYLAGGMTAPQYVVGGLQASVNTITAYNVVSSTWTTLPSIPERRDHVSRAVIRKAFYVVGDRDHGQVNVAGTAAAAAVNGRIYIPGGGIRLGASPVNTFDVFELSQ